MVTIDQRLRRRPRHLVPAARARAAGAGRRRAAARGLRRRRGCGAGRAGRGGGPVARGGIPDNPGGWLYRVALRRLTDQVRSEQARRRREDAVAAELADEQPFAPAPDEHMSAERDDTLVLLFMCCHPALTPPSAIALTLRAVGGLTTAEIANAFLVPEATMAQRISRAKQSIKTSRIPFRLPDRGGARRAAGGGAARPLPDLQRGLQQQHRAVAPARRSRQRGDPARPVGARAAADQRGGRRPAGADAAHRCAPRRPDRRQRRAHPARRAGSDALGPGADRRGNGAGLAGARQRLDRLLPAPGRDRGAARRSRARSRRPTGRRSSRCTGC